ncbi:hypothetical protein PR003_g26046 [Phytophthora rubi]|nr:hypothetical protein PR003_g26046 [Phytophthora rubi]
MPVLKAKGFPPKFCRMIRVMHSGTSVQFMANGALSEKVAVTSGIRQGCPLAPLLFILAVDLLYDEVEATRSLVGVMVGRKDRGIHLKVAGYADATAIYIQHRRMQDTAIRAVARFSAVSGLRLNVGKSAAIALGGSDKDDAGKAAGVEQQIAETSCVRYLGHIAGEGDTTEEAWRRAMGSLKVRLVLAEVKTNTVIQRAAIAAAIIIPKLLYVARHAWPNAQLTKMADRHIRNFVWRASFSEPLTPVAGWINKGVAALPPKAGGVGIPNLEVELRAMSAMVVMKWALTSKRTLQEVGDVLHTRDTGHAEAIVPRFGELKKSKNSTL